MRSRPNPYDNAKADSFMATLKREEVDGGDVIDNIYNRRRLHSALGYHSPAEFESDIINPSIPISKDGSAIMAHCL